ncbi:MAG: hypothetical protein ACREBF_03375 [Candidatus Micrarchaeales archaeon]
MWFSKNAQAQATEKIVEEIVQERIKQQAKIGKSVQETFGRALDASARISGTEIIYPSLAFQVNEKYKTVRRNKDLVTVPELDNSTYLRLLETFNSNVRKAFDYQTRDGRLDRFSVFKAAGSANYFRIGQHAPNYHVKIYARINEEYGPSFVHAMMKWAKERGDVHLEGKFYGDSLFSKNAHNKLCLYMPALEVPIVTEFLVSVKHMFEPVKLNHKLGVQLIPGVSVVLEKSGYASFDGIVDRLFFELADYINLARGDLYILALHGTDSTRGLIKSEITTDHFQFLLARRSNSRWPSVSQATLDEDEFDRTAFKILLHSSA